MKALVTGATGFVGSHLAELLLDKGFTVKCNVRKESNLKWIKDLNVEIVEANLSDKESLKKAVSGVDYVFHVGGRTFGRNYEEFHQANCIGTRNLLEAVYEENKDLKKFVFLSSQTAAGPALSFDKPVLESDEAKPITSYGKSKRAAELEILKFKDKINYTILRASAIYGPRDSAILPVFQTIKKGLGTLIGFDDKYISLLHVKDIVRGLYEAALSEKTSGEIYFLTSADFYTWDYLLEEMKNALDKKRILKLKLPHSVVLSTAWLSQLFGNMTGKPPVFNYEKGIDFIQPYWICSPDKAKEHFNFEQQVKPPEGFIETSDWYKENKWL